MTNPNLPGKSNAEEDGRYYDPITGAELAPPPKLLPLDDIARQGLAAYFEDLKEFRYALSVSGSSSRQRRKRMRLL